MLRKLRLPIFDPANLPACSCGATHGFYGDHAFYYVQSNKKMLAHSIIVEGWVKALQPALATAGYILPTATLATEREHVVECSPGAKPLDLCFDIDPAHLQIPTKPRALTPPLVAISPSLLPFLLPTFLTLKM